MNQARTERVRNEPSTARRREQRLKARLLASFSSRRSPKKTQNHPHDSELTALNKERRFIPLRLDAAPIKGSLAQFLYIEESPI